MEQVGRQLQAVRQVLRQHICKEHFQSVDQHSINLYPSVYSPEVSDATRRERLRYGTVYGSLNEVALMVERRAVTAPLVVSTGSAQLELAEALAALFRCSIGSAVRRELDPPAPARPDPAILMAAIHRELAALHIELAALVDLAPSQAPTPVAEPAAFTVGAAKAPSAAPDVATKLRAVLPPTTPAITQKIPPPLAPPGNKTSSANGHLQRHVVKHVPPSSAAPEHVRAAFLAALQDRQLRKRGLHVGQFCSLVGQRLERDRNLGAWPWAPLGSGVWRRRPQQEYQL
ncbi:hypothetical protein [Arthrobacter sp. MDT1-65]